VHVDSTSFAVSGEYAQTTAREEQTEAEPAIIAITYGYSRDHREERTAVDVGVGDHP
jgi:transposase